MRQGNQKTYVCVACCERERNQNYSRTDLSRAFHKFGVLLYLLLLLFS